MASSRASIPAIAAREAHLLCRQHEGGWAHLPADLHRHLSKVAFAKLYDRKTPITAADLLNDRVVPFFDSHEIKLMRVLTDRGSEYCGNPERHEYELYLRSRTWITRAPRRRARRRTASASASTKPRSTSSIAWRSARRSTGHSPSCRPTSIPGSTDTMRRGHIKDAGASER